MRASDAAGCELASFSGRILCGQPAVDDPLGKLALHEEFPDAVAQAIEPFLAQRV